MTIIKFETQARVAVDKIVARQIGSRSKCNGTCETEMGCDCICDQKGRYQVREVGRPVVPAAFTPDEFIQDLGYRPRDVTAADLLPWALLAAAVRCW